MMPFIDRAVASREGSSWAASAALCVMSLTLAMGLLGACAGQPYEPDRILDPREDLQPTRLAQSPDGKRHTLVGEASWYGEAFHGRTTASGLPYDMYRFTAAHKTLPFHTVVRVTDPRSLKSVVVRITDRGPYIEGRVIDLSYAAAVDLGLYIEGVGPVRLEVLEWGDGSYIHPEK